MKKNVNLSRIVATILTLFMVWGGVTGCKPAVENITVTFDSDGGSAVESIVVEKGKSIETAPTSEKEGYTLDGWYNGETKVEFPYTPEADVTLKAKWVETKTEETETEETETEETETEETETEETETETPEETKPEETKPEETKPEAKWPNALPNDKGAPFTVNADGTVSGTLTAKDNGNGIVVYINKDKSAVAAGNTVKVTFEYKTKEWSDETIKPKFKVALCTAAEDYWSYTNCTEGSESYVEYWDAENLEGSITLSRTASAAADMLAIQFNADKWTGADTDSIDIKLKSVEVIVPDENARKWDIPNITNTPAVMTDNGDGTVSAKVENKWGGTGFVVYINEDKSDITSGKKVKVVFDYSVVEGEWSSEDIFPKFKLELWTKETADYWGAKKASSTSYNDGTALKGTMTVNIDATAAANMLLIGLNPDNLTTEDKGGVNITLKSVEVE